ncbi:hypothetical protein BGZ94_002948, partial [Podila epigama]
MQTRSPFSLPELDSSIASHMDRQTLACAARVSKLWFAIFSPILWKNVSLKHLTEDDHYDDDFNYIPWSPSNSPPPSPSSFSSASWSSSSSAASSPPKDSAMFPQTASLASSSNSSMTTLRNSNLNFIQRAFINSSRNKVLRGLVRLGHHVTDLTATGITDQEMAIIRQCCPNLRVLELIGGRYSVEDLTNLFQARRDSIQVVRFRSCVQLKDIFQPLAQLSNLRVFELYGSFVGNTITSPLFFQQDLFPMLRACPQLHTIRIEQVYIIDQQVGQIFNLPTDESATTGDGGGGGDGSDENTISIESQYLPQAGDEFGGHTSTLSANLIGPLLPQPTAIPSSSLLRKLALDCGDIPASVIMAFLEKCPMLQDLALDWSRELCDFSVSRLQVKCPRLTRVSLSRCEQITDVGFKTLFKSYPNLVHINLSHNYLSDSVLEELARSCRWVQHLDLSHCHNVTDIGVQQLLMNLKTLSYLNLRFVPGLSHLFFDSVLTANLPPIHTNPLLNPPAQRLGLEAAPSRPWACNISLESLLLPDLVQPIRPVLEQYALSQLWMSNIQNNDTSNQNATFVISTESDVIIQHGLRQFLGLKALIIGGNNVDIRNALRDLSSSHILSSLRITKSKRAMTIIDAAWLIETAFPKIQQLNIPQFGNPQVTDWIRMVHP